MNRKPSMLEGQMLSYTQLFQRCAIDMAQRSRNLVMAFIAIAMLSIAASYWGLDILNALGRAIKALFELLNMEYLLVLLLQGLAFAGAVIVAIWEVYAALVVGTYDTIVNLSPSFLNHTVTICRGVTTGEGEKKVLQKVCDVSTTFNYLALAAGITVAFTGFWTVCIAIGLWIKRRDENVVREALEIWGVCILRVAAFSFLLLAYAAGIHYLLVPIFAVVFDLSSQYLWSHQIFLICMAAILSGVLPTVWLQLRMLKNIDEAIVDKKKKISFHSPLKRELRQQLEAKVEITFKESLYMPVRRSVLVVCGSVAVFSIWKMLFTFTSSWLFLVFGAVASAAVVVGVLVCTITCYPNLKQPLEAIDREEKALVRTSKLQLIASRRLAGPVRKLPG